MFNKAWFWVGRSSVACVCRWESAFIREYPPESKKLTNIQGVSSIARHKPIWTKTNFLTLNPLPQSSFRARSFFFCYKYRIKHIIYHHRTTLFVKFSRFASLLFLFCCSHVFILVFVDDDEDFWIRFWLSIFRAVKKALKMKRKRQQQRLVRMKIWTCKWKSSSLALGRNFGQFHRTTKKVHATNWRWLSRVFWKISLTPLSCNTCFYQLISGPTCSSDRMKNCFSNQTVELHSFHKSQSWAGPEKLV